MQPSVRPWTIYLRIGNKETARGSTSGTLAVFCRSGPWDGVLWLCRKQPQKPFPKIKSQLRGSSSLPQTIPGIKDLLSRNIPPAYFWTSAGSLTYSIKSPGWQSSSRHRVSRFSQDTPCWLRNFCKVDWLNSPSVLILLVL